MSVLPDISFCEWSLLVELLQRERDTLPEGPQQASQAETEASLRERLDLIDGLLGRLQEVGCPDYADAT